MHFSKTIFIALIIGFAAAVANAQDVILEKVQRGDKVVVWVENKSGIPQLVSLDMTLENVVSDKKLPLEVIVNPGEKKKLLVLSPIPLKPWSYKTQYRFEEYLPESAAEKQQQDKSRIPNNAPPTDDASSERANTAPIQSGSKMANESSSSAKTQSQSHATSGSDPEARSTGSRPSSDYYMWPPENTDDAPMPARYARRMTSQNAKAGSSEVAVPKTALIVFSQNGCPRCALTRKYLSQHAIPFKELVVTGNDDNQQLMNKYLFDSGFEGGKFMMPVVIVNGEAHYSIADLDGFLSELSAGK